MAKRFDWHRLRRTLQKLPRFFSSTKPKTLGVVKEVVNKQIDQVNQENALRLGLFIIGFPEAAVREIVKRWETEGKPKIRKFAPYFTHIFSVDLFLYLAIAADLIGRDRPKNKVDNKVDIAYLYYLPFCTVFVSNDNLHARVVPLFMRANQTFIKGQELKEDLQRLDERYWALPDDVKVRSPFKFAQTPPDDDSFLVTRLWDKHDPDWRKKFEEHKPLSGKAQKALLDLIKKYEKESKPLDSSHEVPQSEIAFVQFSRPIKAVKGKWLRVPPEALKENNLR